MAKLRTVGRPLPKSHEALLNRELQRMAKRVQATAKAFATQAMQGNPRAVAAALKLSLAREFSDTKIHKIVQARGKAVELDTSKAWGPLMRRAGFDREAKVVKIVRIPYDGEKLVDKWTRQTAKEITSVRAEIAEAMRKDVIAALESGKDADYLVRKWRTQGIPVEFGTVEGRLKTIANSQLHSLQAEAQRERSVAVGVTEQVWRTQGDDRVRDEHRDREGRIYKLDDPPGGELPGQPVNCRCYAESVISDDVLEALGLDDDDMGGAVFEV